MALSDIMADRGISRSKIEVETGIRLDDIREGERTPSLMDIYLIAAALGATPEALVAASAMRLEFFLDTGRNVRASFVGKSRIYTLDRPEDGCLLPTSGRGFSHCADAFRTARGVNKERYRVGLPFLTHIAVYARVAELPLNRVGAAG
jgi:transcriptional regulator with XRE-family HTH domain